MTTTHTTTVPAGPTPAERAAGREPVGTIELRCWIIIVVGTGLLGLAGFANSFERVNQRMMPYFGGLAWSVPLAIDLGILVFSALDLLMAYRDLRSVWLRYVPRALIAVTIYLNIVGETAWEGRISHAVLPAVWAVAVEVAGTAVRTIFGLKTERRQMDRIRRSRWVLAPIATARLRRRMVLREETSFDAAQARDLAYDLAKADMRDRYGAVLWRFRATRRERLLLKRGEVAPVTGVALTAGPALPALPAGTATETGPESTTGTGPQTGPETAEGSGRDRTRTTRRNGTGRSRAKRKDRTPARTWDQTLDAARTVADQMAAEGIPLTRRPFVERMRDAGYPVGTDKAKALLDHLRDPETGEEPAGSEPDDEDPPATAAA